MFLTDKLYFVPLGGAGEIGMNLNAYGYNKQWVIVDLGITFGDKLGIEVIVPDTRFFADKNLLAIVVTHGHEDHIGAIPYVWQQLRCPIYATPFTASLVRRKLREANLDEALVKVVPLSGKFTLGPFTFNLVTLTHSILEPNALAIETPAGVVMHTGDWKIDPDPLIGDKTHEDTLIAWGDRGVLAMIGDSTNAMEEGWSGSESMVREELIKQAKLIKGRIAITCFASNVARLETCIQAAAVSGREAVLVGRSLQKMVESATECGYLTKIKPPLDESVLPQLPRDKTFIICTGSQGEARAALARIAFHQHPSARLESGDTVIFSSRVIPGNEKEIARIHNQLILSGIDVITPQYLDIHVSGHPYRDELRQMYAWVRPLIAIPVHGEARHMHAHAALAQQCGVRQTFVPTNGDIIELSAEGADLVGHFETYPCAIDGNTLIEVNDIVFKERAKLMHNGLVVASLLIGRHDELTEVRFTTQGIWQGDPSMLERLEDALYKAYDDLLGRESNLSLTMIEDHLRIILRREIFNYTGKKPIAIVHALTD